MALSDITISRCLFVFGQLRAKVSAGFTNVSSLAVTPLILILHTPPCRAENNGQQVAGHDF